jgi:polypeptide N-acetylgalactosaminyltransferase
LELTVKSLLYMTPADLLKEIVLVDDYNEKPVPEHILAFPKVKIVHNKKREGLIRSRVFGVFCYYL